MSAKSSLASGYDFSSNDTLNVNLNDFVTSKVYFNIKIANYTEESTGTNKGAIGSGRIVIGLFGNDAPKATSLFLSTIQANPDEYPSYLNAQFLRINEENGLLQMEKLRGLDTVNIGGNEQYEYRNKILTDFKPFVEVTKFKHSRKGLLSRKQFTSGPEFSITTIPCENELDQFHEVFGIVLEGYDVLDAIASIPRYTYKTKTGYASSTKGQDGIIADAWFESQKKFYVGIGKSFGDKRAVDQRGKLLRRVQVIGCGELK